MALAHILVFGAIIGADDVRHFRRGQAREVRRRLLHGGRRRFGPQNGWAIAGDYLSAASFLGIAGLISLYGYDGFMYSVGWLVAYITVLLVIAEPCRNIGNYTLSDILAYRNNPTRDAHRRRAVGDYRLDVLPDRADGRRRRVGEDADRHRLRGLGDRGRRPDAGYVLFGGMVATTWVQIIKAILLVTASIVLVIFVWTPYGFCFPRSSGRRRRRRRCRDKSPCCWATHREHDAEQLGQRFLEPGLYFKAPIDQISLGMALVFGTAGLPHILMRFFTVRPRRMRASR